MSFDPDAPAAAGTLYGLDTRPEDARIVLFPVPWQATTSYRRGTREGPDALLQASAQLDLYDVDFGPVWEVGLAMLDEDPDFRAWDLQAEPDALAVIESGGHAPEAAARVNVLSEQVNARVYDQTRALLTEGRIPGVIGGDHSVPFGAIRAVVEAYPGVGVLHIDAHADLRDAYEGFTWSHASIMHNVLHRLPVSRIVQVGIRDVGAAEVALIQSEPERLRTFFDRDLARAAAEGVPWLRTVREIIAALPPQVYVSFDVDGLDPSLCPNTGTPVPGGLSFRDISLLLVELGRHRQIVGFDLNEIGPAEWDGNVAMRLLYKLCGAASLTK